ncbi:MAG: glycosyltransferase family 4 protein [Alcaligenaceae bacterium]|jgi:glycosyltransferase involved in cell wall biosynthesis|nr:glycosyltransferase family 4 protein [Alcaligenaceae bacterium]
MRIVIDMQGAQTESRFRGIGRYTMAFAQGVARNRGEHEIILALSGLFPDTIEPIRAAFDGLLPQENIRVWKAPGPVMESMFGNDAHREVAELLREAFLASLQPDIIHISSLFEGYTDDAVTSIGRFDDKSLVSVSHYDLIPLLNPKHYLAPNPNYEKYYQRKISYIKQAVSLFAISEFSRQEGLKYLSVPESNVVNVSTAIGNHFKPITIDDRVASQFYQKFGLVRPFVLYTGGADERKNLSRLIQAYALLTPKLRAETQLVFAGKMPDGDIERFKHEAKSVGLKSDELCFTGYISDSELIQLYNLCKLYIFPSWHEGFGLPALEAMACGAVVIGANASSIPEVIALDEALFDPYDAKAISLKLTQGLKDDEFRDRLREHGIQQAKMFSWDETAKRAINAWETLLSSNIREGFDQSLSEKRLYDLLSQYTHLHDEVALIGLSDCLARNHQVGVDRQLLVDISELARHDAKTGIQRVVRSILQEWLSNPPHGYRVEPVYATLDNEYRYARQFTANFMGFADQDLKDEPIDYAPGDVFFVLDLQHHVQISQRSFYQVLRRQGIKVQFLVYDLLCIQFPHYFGVGAHELHAKWIEVVAESDGAVCISKAVANELSEWVEKNAPVRYRPFEIDWFHLGADVDNSSPSKGMPADASSVLDKLRNKRSFLMVGTVEPRKGHTQVLDAFEQLWRSGEEVNLVIVGKQGWSVEELVERLRNHLELNKRLFWLEGVSDEYLESVYAVSTCLIAASYGEGFGLPLIEAAQHKLPIIARDISVFREVAGSYAFYFNSEDPSILAQSIKEWLVQHGGNLHLKSDNMPWLTWRESAKQLLNIIINNDKQDLDRQKNLEWML